MLTTDKYPTRLYNLLRNFWTANENMEGIDLTSIYTTIGGVLGTPAAIAV